MIALIEIHSEDKRYLREKLGQEPLLALIDRVRAYNRDARTHNESMPEWKAGLRELKAAARDKEKWVLRWAIERHLDRRPATPADAKLPDEIKELLPNRGSGFHNRRRERIRARQRRAERDLKGLSEVLVEDFPITWAEADEEMRSRYDGILYLEADDGEDITFLECLRSTCIEQGIDLEEYGVSLK